MEHKRDLTRDFEALQRDRLDERLASMLNGHHRIPNDHEYAVIMIEEILILHQATEAMGWARHTGDWDWFVQFTMRDGTVIGALGDEDASVIGSFDFYERPKDFTACVQYDEVSHIAYTDDELGDAVQVKIDEIEWITWERA